MFKVDIACSAEFIVPLNFADTCTDRISNPLSKSFLYVLTKASGDGCEVDG